MTIKVLVCGGRDYTDALTVGSWLGGIHKQRGISLIIEGGARGADQLGRLFAEYANIPCDTYPADWEGLGKKAGPIRNQQMLDEGKPDLVLAFPSPNSRGTYDMIKRAKKAGVEVVIGTTVRT